MFFLLLFYRHNDVRIIKYNESYLSSNIPTVSLYKGWDNQILLSQFEFSFKVFSEFNRLKSNYFLALMFYESNSTQTILFIEFKSVNREINLSYLAKIMDSKSMFFGSFFRVKSIRRASNCRLFITKYKGKTIQRYTSNIIPNASQSMVVELFSTQLK